MMTKKMLAVVVSAAILSASNVATAAPEAMSPVKDPGVVNQERIVYWLTKRGELSSSATQEEKNNALEKYLQRADRGYTTPKELLKKEARALNKSKKKSTAKKADNTTVKVLSILIDFPDLPYNNNRLTRNDTNMFYSNYSVEHYQDLQFSTSGYTGPGGENLISGYQFYQRESGGSFFFTGDTFGWVTANNNANYYGGNDPDNDDSDKNVPALVKEAVQKAVEKYNIDLSEYDIEDPYDKDNDGDLNEPDGDIDHVMIYHSSVGEEAGGGVLADDAIWSHRYYVYSNNEIPNTGKRVFGYTVQPIDAAAGVVVHEFGHDLGLPDEYDTGKSNVGSPVGNWSVMAGGSWAGQIPGTQPVGFSAYGRDYFQNKFGGDWIDQVTINLEDLENGAQDYSLVEAVDHASPHVNQIRVNLPKPELPFAAPYSGEYQFHSGSGDNLDNAMSMDVTLPSAGNISMTMKAHWNIEKDWDFAQVKVNGVAIAGNHTTAVNPLGNDTNESYSEYYQTITNYLSGKSADIAGAEGENSWVNLSFDLSAYAGQSITLELSYITDTNTGDYGLVIDDLSINAAETQVVFAGAETVDEFNLDGFSRIGSTRPGAENRYWIQLRSYNGVDVGLQSENYKRGVVLWYGNDAYTNNKVGDHPGYGFIGVVDANQALIGTNGASTQIRDAAFHIDDKSLFRDVDDYSRPQQPESGLVLPVNGFQFEILSQESSSSLAEIQLRKVSLELTSEFTTKITNRTIEFSNRSYGGDGDLTYSWSFGDGSESSAISPTHTYAADGVYNVTLTVTDASANTHTSSQQISIGRVPDAGFSFTTDDLKVNFTNSSTGGFGNVTYTWDFGDGSTSSEQSPSHTYSSPGTYTVKLTITDAQSNTDTISKSVTVKKPKSSGGGGSLPLTILIGLLMVAIKRK